MASEQQRRDPAAAAQVSAAMPMTEGPARAESHFPLPADGGHHKVKPTEWSLKVYDRILASITALGLIGGAFWTVLQYRVERDKEAAARRTEYLIQLRREKQELYEPLRTAIAKIGTAKTMGDARPFINQFWEMYWGDLHLIKDRDVHNAKEDYSRALLACQDQTDREPDGELRTLGIALLEACADSTELARAYELPVPDYGEQQGPQHRIAKQDRAQTNHAGE